MRTNQWSTVGILAALGLGAVAASATAAEVKARPNDPLAPLAFLAGHCWVAPFPDGKSTDTHCFEWLYGRQQLIDRHVVRGPGPEYRGETLYLWDAGSGQIIYRYVDSAGGHSDGRVEASSSGLHFPADEYVGADGSRVTFVTDWRRIDANHYEARVRQRIGEELRDAMHFKYERTESIPDSTAQEAAAVPAGSDTVRHP